MVLSQFIQLLHEVLYTKYFWVNIYHMEYFVNSNKVYNAIINALYALGFQ